MQSSTILRSSRREATFVAIVWALACLYTVGYAGLFAYRRGAAPELVLGMPSWVAWGVIVPWVVTSLVTCWYAMRGIQDEDLGEEQEQAPHSSAPEGQMISSESND